MKRNAAWLLGSAGGACLLVAIWSEWRWQFVVTGGLLLLVAVVVASVPEPRAHYDGVTIRSVDLRYGGDNTVQIQIELGRGDVGAAVDVASLPPQAREALRRWTA